MGKDEVIVAMVMSLEFAIMFVFAMCEKVKGFKEGYERAWEDAISEASKHMRGADDERTYCRHFVRQ